jgi:hypothetical protein
MDKFRQNGNHRTTSLTRGLAVEKLATAESIHFLIICV